MPIICQSTPIKVSVTQSNILYLNHGDSLCSILIFVNKKGSFPDELFLHFAIKLWYKHFMNFLDYWVNIQSGEEAWVLLL